MFRFACQTYTWQMLGPAWTGTTGDMLDQIAAAGYEGIEITERMIGEFAAQPGRFADELAARELSFAAYAVTLGSAFADEDRAGEFMERLGQAIEFVRPYAGVRLQLGSPREMPGAGSRLDQLERACDLCNHAGRIAAAAGVPLHLHPNSAETSLVKSLDAYGYLINDLDPDLVELCLDTGHVLRCGLDVVQLLEACGPRLVHLHLKDVTSDGRWASLGEGVCPLDDVFAFLRESDYSGWVVCEEESDAAARDPASGVASALTAARVAAERAC